MMGTGQSAWRVSHRPAPLGPGLWVQAWRRTQAHSDVIVVRFADDIVLGFQSKSEAERFCRRRASGRSSKSGSLALPSLHPGGHGLASVSGE